jgi:hypothetical protein
VRSPDLAQAVPHSWRARLDFVWFCGRVFMGLWPTAACPPLLSPPRFPRAGGLFAFRGTRFFLLPCRRSAGRKVIVGRGNGAPLASSTHPVSFEVRLPIGQADAH